MQARRLKNYTGTQLTELTNQDSEGITETEGANMEPL